MYAQSLIIEYSQKVSPARIQIWDLCGRLLLLSLWCVGRLPPSLWPSSHQLPKSTVSKRVPILRTWSLKRISLAFWVLSYISGSLFSLFLFHSGKECQFAGIGSGSHCWQILLFTYAYVLIFIHRRFGSWFWLPGVLIGSLFYKRVGPYWVLIS